MLNLIPALLLLLTSGPFGPSADSVRARLDSSVPRALVVKLARELEKAGFSAAQATLVMASCDQVRQYPEFSAVETAQTTFAPPLGLRSGFDRGVRSRDGPRL